MKDIHGKTHKILLSCIFGAVLAIAAVAVLFQCMNSQEMRTVPVLKPVDGVLQGAAGVLGNGDVVRSPYYTAPDYYRGGVTPTLLLLPEFKTYQQTSERSCGGACALMGLYRLGIRDVSEDQIDKEMDIRYYDNPREDGSYGATTASIAKAFSGRGFSVQSSADTQGQSGSSFPEIGDFTAFLKTNLSSGNILITENVEWGGHWMVLIGYDSLGTEATADDILVFADPYDTTDHLQDGYLTVSLERYYYSWFDHQVLPAGERVQQYVLVKSSVG